ncbi:MAG: histidine--tRNA ligase [Tannerellaceae bacterium]|jgi:histidyl-tRNA synthetase|nr:histidine--tRNA ligase [Tannerellaceae bacterium]
MQKPSVPKGTRDFSPEEMAKRNYIFNTIRKVFHLFGYQQIETPAIEMLATLMGKYGEEGDTLLFKVLNSGRYLEGIADGDLLERNEKRLTMRLCEKGLRYDLTVPFARYVAMHRSEIVFPFKRYQIQPVWRADRPQKGRYREFYQCDADVIGSESLLNEVELAQMMIEVFRRLRIRIDIRINNRKIWGGMAEAVGMPEKLADMTVAVDKLDKIGLESVEEELAAKGFDGDAIRRLRPMILLEGSNESKLERLRTMLEGSPTGLKGVEELEEIFAKLKMAGEEAPLTLDTTLARGLGYYTGAIFEVKALDVEMGSIAGGGRYDNLTGVFGLSGVSGVGVSFGADRIFDVLNRLELYPDDGGDGPQILFVNFGAGEDALLLPLLARLRAEGVRAELYPEAVKLRKQMAYADARNIPFVAIAGENELAAAKITLKNMRSGEQMLVDAEDILRQISPNP